jgi:hypothetical protein
MAGLQSQLKAASGKINLVRGGSSFRWNDNNFLQEILRRKGLKQPIKNRDYFSISN